MKYLNNRIGWSLLAIAVLFIAQGLGYTVSADELFAGGLMMAGVGDIYDVSELRGKRSALAQEVRAMLDKSDKAGKKWESADDEFYNAKMAEIDDIDKQISRIQAYIDKVAEENIDNSAIDALNAQASKRGKNTNEIRALHEKWVRQGDQALSAEDWQKIRNTMSVGTNSQGGYTVQTEVAQAVADAMKLFGGMRQEATVIQTAMGNTIQYPTSDGTAETGEIIGENTTATGADPSFGAVSLPVYKFSSKVVAVPFELLQDSNVDIEAFINKRLIQRIGRIQNTKFTIGSGTGEPQGIVTAATAGKVGTTGQTATVIFDDLVDLEHSVDAGYRALGNCCFMMNDSSFKVIKKLKDSQNRPIFLPGYDGISGPVPQTLLGYDICINNDVATMAANAKSILFGDYSFYVIRDVMDYTLFRFTDSAYAKLGQVGFLMWARSGGAFTDVGGAVKYYQNSAS